MRDIIFLLGFFSASYRNLEEQLRADLLRNYTASTRPVLNASRAVDVKAGFGVSQILYLVNIVFPNSQIRSIRRISLIQL